MTKTRNLEAAKPSNLAETHPEIIVTYDDVFVDELKRTLRACVVFCWFPIYWLCYSQMTNNLISQASTMLTGNVPNDIMQNINPIALVCIHIIACFKRLMDIMIDYLHPCC